MRKTNQMQEICFQQTINEADTLLFLHFRGEFKVFAYIDFHKKNKKLFFESKTIMTNEILFEKLFKHTKYQSSLLYFSFIC